MAFLGWVRGAGKAENEDLRHIPTSSMFHVLSWFQVKEGRLRKACVWAKKWKSNKRRSMKQNNPCYSMNTIIGSGRGGRGICFELCDITALEAACWVGGGWGRGLTTFVGYWTGFANVVFAI